MLGLIYLSMLAGLFALVFNLQTVLALSKRVIDRFVKGLSRRSIPGRRQFRAHKNVTRHRRFVRSRSA